MKWKLLIHQLVEMAEDSAETGYITYPLHDEMGSLCAETFQVLSDTGVSVPKESPKEIEVDDDNGDEVEL